LPELEKAIKALDTLEPKHIGEMRGYANPPADLVLLMGAVQYLLDVKGAWPEAVQMMKDPNAFIASLKSFDKDNIKEKKLKGLKQFVNDPRLKPAAIKKKSLAGESIAMWVHAMDLYAEVKKIVDPKRRD
jgi:dynein heavy chain, axonemal